MNPVIQDIINRKCKDTDKNKALDILSEEIEIARGIVSGKFKYCSKCNDYYLANSYFTEEESKKARICVYEDPINSGGNDYIDGYIDILYRVCPKGHREEVHRQERR